MEQLAQPVTWLAPDRPVEGGTVYVRPEPADLQDPDLDHRDTAYDRYVADLHAERDMLIAAKRHRCIQLELIERELRMLGEEL